MNRLTRRGLTAALLAVGLFVPRAEALVRDEKPALADKLVRHPGLHIPTALQPASDLQSELGARVQRDVAALGIEGSSAFYDARAGRLISLMVSEPLVPGTGVGNTLAGARPRDDDASRETVWSAVRAYLQSRQAILRVDIAELGAPSIGITEEGALIQVHVPRVLNGIVVRDSGVTAIINHGNLVLLGLENWADFAGGASAAFGETQARLRVVDHLKPLDVESIEGSRLEYVPMVKGDGYEYRLVWAVRATVVGDLGSWEGLVDAANGELLAFADRNEYASRRMVGGVYPLSNDQRVPDGVEQAGWPMPFANVTIGANTVFTNSGGSLGCANAGAGSTTLAGQFVRITDTCGGINETAAAGVDFDLGTSAGTDCTVPAGHSVGDTHSARSGFYELNRVVEQAKGYLPANAWLNAQLTSNMNLNQTCNAFWNGSTVNFYRDSGSACRNTGEIAAIFDHEWGHGLDDNGANGNISSPGESIADIHATLRLANSCVGRGFRKTAVCGGYGDPCTGTATTGCTGVRDADFALHVSGLPHGITWIRTGANGGAGCSTGGTGPCGRETHCEGQTVSEIAWDLQARDLRGAPFNFDSNTALELTTRLFYLGAETVTSWYTCAAGCEAAGTCGCGATGGYLLVLAADDDNGNLNDGTPHMQAIRTAFNRHQMACTTPAVANSGCAGGPTTAPTVTATAGIDSVGLSWAAVPGASRYFVYRTEGVAACNFGKVKVGDVTGLAFTDTGLLSGRQYSYVVLPVGANTSCFGLASACASATPTPANCGATPDYTLSCSPSSLTVSQGGNGTSTCTVQSLNAFASAVTLSCTGLPAGVTCAYVPPSVTPAPNGAAPSTLTVTVGAAVAPGAYPFQAQGVGAALTRTFNMTLNVNAVSVAPFALAVDAAGNGVFQPNETVTMAPTWRNTGAAPVTLTGATSGFTGPAGPVYTNPDNAANYGTIGVAANGTCSTSGNCYSVNAAAATRPLTHWDSTILETVTPTSTTKTWILHVGDSFTDVPASNGFYRFVETILHKQVTGGCTPTTYCPSSSTTREQMAVFVLVSKEPAGFLPPPCGATPMFTDVPVSSPFCRWIEELARRGVVSGCGAGLYCPSAAATRDQMSVFVLRTLDPTLNPPACGTPVFADVPASNPFCRWIEELVRRGVVTGCGGGNYCPTAVVTRDQMAVFLTVTFGLTLYGL